MRINQPVRPACLVRRLGVQRGFQRRQKRRKKIDENPFLGDKAVAQMILNKAKRETWLFYAVITGTLLAFVVAVMAIAPAI